MQQGRQREVYWLSLLVLLLLLVDQVVKIWIKTTMTIGQEHYITSWFRIAFIENEGMAFGLTLGSKLFLTLFRIVAMGALGYYLYLLTKTRAYSIGFLSCLSLVLAGGLGNIIDCVFYGQIFTESTRSEVAQLVAWGQGYERLFYGHVVDMLYFPMIEGTLPDWLPIWGGEDFVFFRPVFNLADSYISVAVVALLLFYPRTLMQVLEGDKSDGNTSGKSLG